jgi:hypothetical protein
VAECFTFFPVEISCSTIVRRTVAVGPLVARMLNSDLMFSISTFPYNAVIGFDTQNDGLDFNDRAIVNGRVLPRNTFRQPAFATLDIAS